jgi:hypothetical protein
VREDYDFHFNAGEEETDSEGAKQISISWQDALWVFKIAATDRILVS